MQSALAHMKRGEFRNAEEALSEVTRAAPTNADAWFLLGAIALQASRVSKGATFLERAAALSPNNAIYLTNLGEAYRRLNLLERAIEHLERAASISPRLAAAHFNLGLALRAAGRAREGLAALQRAVAIAPDIDGEAQLAEALCTEGLYEQAEQHARRVLTKRPSSAAHLALGNALQGKGSYDKAIREHSRAIELEPERVSAHIGKGRALWYVGRADESLVYYRQAAKLEPANALPHVFIAENLVWSGCIAEAVISAKQAVELSHDPGFHSSLIYMRLLDPNSDEAAIHAETLDWRRRFEEPLMAKRRNPTRDRGRGRRLRVGYVSSGFREKVDSHFTLPLLAHHNREQFEIYCYSYTRVTDAFTEKHRTQTDVWRDVARLTDDEVAELIQSDSIDILVDLGLHASDGHLTLFALKPAPVQISWLAYPGTTGLQAMDYRMTDPYLDSREFHNPNYSEQSLWLPETFWCYDPLRSEPSVNDLLALRNGYVTFASFNRFSKVNSQVLELWARVLRSVEGSRLEIYVTPGVHTEQVYRPFDKLGVARDRIRFTPAESKHEFLLMHHDVDMALDPFPCNGGGTSLDALWMGVPVITLVGKTSVGRIGLSLMSNLGLDEFVAHTPEHYVEIAVSLSDDFARLAELRKGLRTRLEQSPLMDAPRFASNMESAFRQAWDNWCSNCT